MKRILPAKLYSRLRETYRRRAWKNARYHCSCCGMPVKDFWPFIRDGNTADWSHYHPENYLTAFNNCVCPFCGSLPRQRMCAHYLSEERRVDFPGAKLLKPARVLFFAPEESLIRYFSRVGITPTTADLYRSDVDLQIDIEETHLSAGCFDLILCNHVLQHVSDYKRALRECSRLLTSDGRLLFTVAMDKTMPSTLETQETLNPEQRRMIYGEDDYLRLFGADLCQTVADCGLTLELFNGGMFPPEIHGICGPAKFDADILFVCSKG